MCQCGLVMLFLEAVGIWKGIKTNCRSWLEIIDLILEGRNNKKHVGLFISDLFLYIITK